MTQLELAEKIIIVAEGWRNRPYYCTEGFPTVGFGRVVGKKDDPLPNIIVKREDEIGWVRNRIKALDTQLQASIRCYSSLSDVRQATLISMAYQLGLSGLMAFRKMIAALNNNDFIQASVEILDSRYASQTPNRANRNANMIALGKLDKHYV